MNGRQEGQLSLKNMENSTSPYFESCDIYIEFIVKIAREWNCLPECFPIITILKISSYKSAKVSIQTCFIIEWILNKIFRLVYVGRSFIH